MVFFPLIVSVAVIVVVPGFRPVTTTSPLGEALSLSSASLIPAAPVALLLALGLCLASVPVAQRQLLRRVG